jgi:glycogen debranching enzyme
MFLIALENFISLKADNGETKKWEKLYGEVKSNIRKHIWDKENQKFRPHVYIQEKAFPEVENENDIFYHGGTAVAIQAGLLSNEEIRISLDKMIQNVKDAQAQSIGLTLYPVYPENSFMNKGMVPFGYQNGGDWTWFGARMITALVHYGFINEAYEELEPMIDRVITNEGFFEWYTVDGKPTGSGEFRGSAGVLMEAIDALEEWAEKNR